MFSPFPSLQRAKRLAVVACVGEKSRCFLSHIYSDQFFSLSQFCLPLKTCSSSDFDAVGDVKTALKRHRWADDDDKERSD